MLVFSLPLWLCTVLAGSAVVHTGRCAARASEMHNDAGAGLVSRATVMTTGIALWAVSFAIYHATSYAGLAPGDSGELMGMACAGGVPHPPGYPLLMLQWRWWLSLLSRPLREAPGNVARHLHLLTAIQCATCVVLMYFSMILLLSYRTLSVRTRKREGENLFTTVPLPAYVGAVGGALAQTCSTTFWQYATHAEVFALNNVMCSLLLLLCLLFAVNPTRLGAACGALVRPPKSLLQAGTLP